jgi:hypothetical protein
MSFLSLMPLVDKVLDFIPNPAEKLRVKAEMEAAGQRGELDLLLGQLEINKVEAAHKSLFVAGARPFIMWVCGIALAYSTVIHPILDIWLEMPSVDVSVLMPVLMGLLGLGGMRSFEKFKGVARER